MYNIYLVNSIVPLITDLKEENFICSVDNRIDLKNFILSYTANKAPYLRTTIIRSDNEFETIDFGQYNKFIAYYKIL